MAVDIPDLAVAAFTDQARLYNQEIAILTAAMGPAPHGVQSGCVTTQQGVPNMTVATSAGVVRIAGRKVTLTAATGTIGTAPATVGQARIDLIVGNSNGTVTTVAGIAGTAPVAPAWTPATQVVLSQVYVQQGTTSITTSRIKDRRVMIPDPGYEDGYWYGMRGDDATDNTAAFNAMLASVPTTIGLRGRRLVFQPGIYRFATTPTMPSQHVFTCEFVGLSGAPINVTGSGSGVVGVLFKAMTASMTLLSFNAQDFGSTNINAGPTIRNIAFFGSDLAGTSGLLFRQVNRATVDDCSFTDFRDTAIRVDGGIPPVSGADSSWHNWYNNHFADNTVSMDISSAAVNIFGGSMVGTAATTQTGVINRGSMLNVFGMCTDHMLIAFDLVGGQHNHFFGLKIELCTTGVRIREAGTTSNFNGDKMSFVACSMGSTTTGFDIGTNCTRNYIIGAAFDTTATPYLFADQTARRSTIIIDAIADAQTNLDLASVANSAPSDAIVPADQFRFYSTQPTGGMAVTWRGKNAAGTAFQGPSIFAGAGSPNGVVTAPVGALYLNLSGGTGQTLWVKEQFAGNTGWVAK